MEEQHTKKEGSDIVTEIKKFFDSRLKAFSVNLPPGEFYVTSDPEEVITTILGSCVAVCIRDIKLGVGGMNHFLLASPSNGITSLSNRYGSFAMEQLINSILKKGGHKNDFEIKVYGGSNLFKNMNNVGLNNIKFIQEYFKTEGLRVDSEDVGGEVPRKIFYWPKTGQVVRNFITTDSKLIQQETEASTKQLSFNNQHSGSVELF